MRKELVGFGFILALILLSVYLYQPSFDVPFFGDQIGYIAEREGSTSFKDGLKFMDYALARKYWKGDEAIFRPLIFLVLAAEYSVLSYRYADWNRMNLVFHLFCVMALWFLLQQSTSIEYASLLALLFSSSEGLYYLIPNSHQGGYMLAFGCFSIGLLAVSKIAQPEKGGEWFWIYALTMTLASFFLEMVMVFSLCCAFYAGVKRMRNSHPLGWGRVVLMLVPAISYLSFYFLHLQGTARANFVDRGDVQSLWSIQNFMSVPGNMLVLFRNWMVDLAPQANALNITVLALAAFVLLKGAWQWEHLKKNAGFLILLFVILITYAALLCLARGDSVLSHHTYFAAMILILMAPLVFHFQKRGASPPFFVLFIFAGLLLINARAVRAYTENMNREAFNQHLYLQSILKDPSLPRGSQEVDPEILLIEGYPDQDNAPRQIKRYSEILFAPEISHD